MRMPETTRQESRFRFNGFELDVQTGELRRRDGSSPRLQPQPLQLLLALLRRPGRIVTREELRESLWPKETFVEFDDGLRHAVARLREALGDSAQQPRYIETIPRRGYRFIGPVAVEEAEPAGVGQPGQPSELTQPAGRQGAARFGRFSLTRLRLLSLAGCLVVLFAVVTGFFHFRSASALTEKDQILLADFENLTGDAVFDVTLRQALAVQLEQSPYLQIVPAEQVRRALAFMGRPATERLTEPVARELCQREGIKAMLGGSLTSLGSHYVLSLEVESSSGNSLAREQVEVAKKEEILQALSKSVSRLRQRLGESLSSVQKLDVPLTQATTTSLEALKWFALGDEMRMRVGNTEEALQLYERAIELDPDFAIAYARAGNIYSLRGDRARAEQCLRKAFALSGRISEREKFYASSVYHLHLTGELDKAIAVLEVYKRTYPRDNIAYNHLAAVHMAEGLVEQGLEETRQTIALRPDWPGNYLNLARNLVAADQLSEARTTAERHQSEIVDSEAFSEVLFLVASLQGDQAEMRRVVQAETGKPNEHAMLALEAADAESHGRLRKAREQRRLAAELALQRGLKAHAANYYGAAALREALWGNCSVADNYIRQAQALASGDQTRQAVALAMCGEPARARALAEEMRTERPNGTLNGAILLPSIEAAIEFHGYRPERAIELLRPASGYDRVYGLPVYLRGLAYLRAGQGAEAAGQFQRIVDYPGAYAFQWDGSKCDIAWDADARLGLARAAALAGDVPRSRKAYQDLFSQWKDADPDLPLLRQARAEYARLK